jgi:hypothetical protein
MDPDPALDPDPSVIKLNNKKSAWFLLFCDFFFIFYVSVTSKSKKQKNFFKHFFLNSMTKIAGSGSASRSLVKGMDPDQQHNVMDLNTACE